MSATDAAFTPGQTIFLNGASSSGKSSVARELQALLLPAGYLHTGLDHILERIPASWWGHHANPDGFRLVSTRDAKGPRTEMQIGPGGRRMLAGARRAMATLARAGVPLIIDEVLFERTFLDDYVRAFTGLPVLFVGVRCPAAIAAAREQARGNRSLGAARVQTALVHTHAPYDLEVDTSLLSPRACAEGVVAALRHPPEQPVFRRLADNII